MNWEAVGSIGELLGAVGVIASLLYLSVQVRQSSTATKLATSHSIASAARDWNRAMIDDIDLSWVFQVGTEDPSRLDDKERSQFLHVCFSFFRMFEDIHYQYEHGAVDEDLWAGYARHFGAYAKQSPGVSAYWEMRRDIFRPAFRDFLDNYVPPNIELVDALVRRGAPNIDEGPGE